MVEEEFMECRSSERAKKLALKAIQLPTELTMEDRRALDLAVFEVLGVADADEREELCDELYHETADHFRQIRIVEIQKQEQRAHADGREFRTDELVADLWDGLADEDKQPLSSWLEERVSGGRAWDIPEGHVKLPDASDMLDATTVFIRQSSASKGTFNRLVFPWRSHAEIVFTLAQLGLRGRVRLPDSEVVSQELKTQMVARLDGISTKASHLAASRTSDERKADDLARLLRHWMIHGKPSKRAEQGLLEATPLP